MVCTDIRNTAQALTSWYALCDTTDTLETKEGYELMFTILRQP